MSMGRRTRERQGELWVATDALPDAPRHVFYEKLNSLLAEAGFDEFVEDLCREHYAAALGRPGIPPGVYFRMLLVGYFEGIDGQRGIAWRCADSLSLKQFLGYALAEATPEHSSLTRVRQRLPLSVHEQVFAFVLRIAEEKGLLKGKTVGVDSTTLEANAAMKSIVRKDNGEDYQEYLRRLMAGAGLIEDGEEPSAEDLRRFDRQRKGKKLPNSEWESTTDPDARVIKMKDGRTHLGYKAEHVVDLETEFVLSAQVYLGTEADSATLLPSLAAAQVYLVMAGSEVAVQEAATDKGYHKNETIADCAGWQVRTYIPEPEGPNRKWTDKPPDQKQAVVNNRRRTRGAYGRKLGRLRSELVERSFAHVCETGGARRTWLRGLENVRKRYTIQAAGRNLGLLMRKLFGVGKPRALQGASAAATEAGLGLYTLLGVARTPRRLFRSLRAAFGRPGRSIQATSTFPLAI